MNLSRAIAEGEHAFELFLNNQFVTAERRMAVHADRSIYHALFNSGFLFIKAMMSCEKVDIEKAMDAVQSGCTLVSQFRVHYSLTESLLHRLWNPPQKRRFTEEQMHAELCYAELLVCRALLTFFADESLASFIRGAFRIRSCYQSFKECHRMLHSPGSHSVECLSAEDAALRRQFEAGVRSGMGVFNLMLSSLPSRVLSLLHLVGFSGDKDLGMAELLSSASMPDTLRGTMASMIVLCYQLVVSHLIGCRPPDLPLCASLLGPLTRRFPNGAIVLFLRARFHLVGGRLDQSVQLYHRSINSQRVYRQFHHICHWELVFAHTLMMRWNRAAWHAKKLLDESRWSKCVYTYLLATLVDADKSARRRQEAVAHLMRQVPSLRWRIAGKSIPIEKFCERKAKKYFGSCKGTLLLPQFEFLYFWNGFSILERAAHLVRPILAHIDEEETRWAQTNEAHQMLEGRLLCTFLRGLCFKALRQFERAERCLGEIVENHFMSHHQLPHELAYLPPNACFEWALCRIASANDFSGMEDAEPMLERALCYKGYAMETKLHFRVHSALEQLKRERTERSKRRGQLPICSNSGHINLSFII